MKKCNKVSQTGQKPVSLLLCHSLFTILVTLAVVRPPPMIWLLCSFCHTLLGPCPYCPLPPPPIVCWHLHIRFAGAPTSCTPATLLISRCVTSTSQRATTFLSNGASPPIRLLSSWHAASTSCCTVASYQMGSVLQFASHSLAGCHVTSHCAASASGPLDTPPTCKVRPHLLSAAPPPIVCLQFTGWLLCRLFFARVCKFQETCEFCFWLFVTADIVR